MDPETRWWLVRLTWMAIGAGLTVLVIAAVRASQQVKVTTYDASDHGRLGKARERMIHIQDLQDARNAGL